MWFTSDFSSGLGFGMAKRNLDEIDRSNFGHFAKRNQLDEIDRSDFDRFVKKRDTSQQQQPWIAIEKLQLLLSKKKKKFPKIYKKKKSNSIPYKKNVSTQIDQIKVNVIQSDGFFLSGALATLWRLSFSFIY